MLSWRMAALIVLCGLHAVVVSSTYQDSESSSTYDFSYEVRDAQRGQDFGHSESRQVGRTQGEYYVLLPDGRRQVVNYYADETGFYPAISYQESSTDRHLSSPNNPGQWESDFSNSDITNSFGKNKNVMTPRSKFQSNFFKQNFEQDSLRDLSDDSKSQIGFGLESKRWKGSISIGKSASSNSEIPESILNPHSQTGQDKTPSSLFLKVSDQSNYEQRDPSNLFVSNNDGSLTPPNSKGQFSFTSPKVSSIVTFHELENDPKPSLKESAHYHTGVTQNQLPISKVVSNESSNDHPLFTQRGKDENTFSFRPSKKPRIFKVITLPNPKISISRDQVDKTTENIRSNDENIKFITLHLPTAPLSIKENERKVIKHISFNNVHRNSNKISKIKNNKPGINSNSNSYLKSDHSTSFVTHSDIKPFSYHKNAGYKEVTKQYLDESFNFNGETGEVHFDAQGFQEPPDYENVDIPKYSFTSGHNEKEEAYGDQRRLPKTNKVKFITDQKFSSGNNFPPKYPSFFPPKNRTPSLSQTQNNRPNFHSFKEQKPKFFHPSFRPRFNFHSSVPFKPYRPPRQKFPPISKRPSNSNFLPPTSQHDPRPNFPFLHLTVPKAPPPAQFPFKPTFSLPSKPNSPPTSQPPSKSNFFPPFSPPPRPSSSSPSVPNFFPTSEPPPQPNFPPPSQLPPRPNPVPPSSTPSPIPRRFVPEGPVTTEEPTPDLPTPPPTSDVNPNDLAVPKIVPVIIPVEGDLPFNETPLSEDDDFSDLGDYPDEDYL